MKNTINEFLNKRKMNPQDINPVECGKLVRDHMASGLEGNVIDMPMIKTYLTGDGDVPFNQSAIVIDAGGTNYRCGLASFDSDGCHITEKKVMSMPGKDAPVPWESFVSFVVDSFEHIIDKADRIGFCFSYSAEIMPDCDGKVITIDKEVNITGCEGKLIGVSINEELARRGYASKRVVILNDTVAALLGGSSALTKSDYSGLTGMICGTGFNLCISQDGMLYNTEAGFFNGIPQSDADAAVDAGSLQPGEKLLEKMTSGAYLGPVFSEALREAVKDRYLPQSVEDRLEALGGIGSSVVDRLTNGEDSKGLFDSLEDLEFAMHLARAVFERSARCVCSAMIGNMLLNGSGKDADKPAAFCAEGSLIEKSSFFKIYLEELLNRYALEKLGLHSVIILGSATTLPGSAAAALLN